MPDPSRYKLDADGEPLTVESLRRAGVSPKIKSMEAALDNYLLQFCSALPASTASINKYIQWSVQSGYAPATISVRVSLLGTWHKEAGFPDPTDDPSVTNQLKGLRKRNIACQKVTRPLGAAELTALCQYLDRQIVESERILEHSSDRDDRPVYARLLRATRDKALLLVGFWFAYRSKDLVRLDASRTNIINADGGSAHSSVMSLEMILLHSEGDRNGEGSVRSMAQFNEEFALICPVIASHKWLDHRGKRAGTGPLFVGINRWGKLSHKPMAYSAMSRWLRELMTDAGLNPEGFTSRSLRRGLETWAAQGKGEAADDIASWVEWKSLQTAEKPTVDPAESLPNRLIDERKGSLPNS